MEINDLYSSSTNQFDDHVDLSVNAHMYIVSISHVLVAVKQLVMLQNE